MRSNLARNQEKEIWIMMQTILTAIAEGNLRMGMETMDPCISQLTFFVAQYKTITPCKDFHNHQCAQTMEERDKFLIEEDYVP